MFSLRKAPLPVHADPRRRPRAALARGAGTAALLAALALPATAAADTAYVVSGANSVLNRVDAAAGPPDWSAQLRNVGWGMGTLTVTPDGKTVYVLTDRWRSVTPVDAATLAAGDPIEIAAGPGSGDAGVAGIAATPDGSTVLVSSASGDAVTPIATATNRAGEPIAVEGPTAIAIAPDGRTAYVTTSDRTLTPIDLATRRAGPPIALGHAPGQVAITPDGALALVGETDAGPTRGWVQVVDLATATAEAPVPVDDRALLSLALAPDGRTAYLAEAGLEGSLPWPPADGGRIVSFDVGARTVGARVPPTTLTSPAAPVSLAVSSDSGTVFGVVPCGDTRCMTQGIFSTDLATGTSRYGTGGSYPAALALAPDPSAGFTTAGGVPGEPSSFDAGPSRNAGGTITGYTWRFGDGTPAVTTAGPTTTHTYARVGTYAATLTTSNLGGCAARLVFTGQGAACTGLPTATTTRYVRVAEPWRPPPATVATAHTTGASDITTTRALLHGAVDLAEISPSWRFEYGTTTSYGKATAAQTLDPVRGRVPVQATVAGLAPNTRYHYRLAIETPGRQEKSYGGDETFVTPANGALRVRSRALAVMRGAVRVPLRCDSAAACRGRLVLRSGTARCASATVRIGARRTVSTRLALGRACRVKLSRARNHRIGAKLTGTFTTGQKRFAATVRLTR